MLQSEVLEPSISANFYRVVIKVVLLFGADTWVMLAPMDQRLNGVRVGFL